MALNGAPGMGSRSLKVAKQQITNQCLHIFDMIGYLCIELFEASEYRLSEYTIVIYPDGMFGR